jgi:hypothetical protein
LNRKKEKARERRRIRPGERSKEMRLKTTLSKQIQLLQDKNLNNLIGDDNRSNDLMLNGGNTSTSSSSASAGMDDLEMDSADVRLHFRPIFSEVFS